jgi:LuxR family maltose regulon positive regulatory protein
MAVPLVETKLFLPAERPGTVARPRLRDRLSREGGRVVLVSAPAGFGKTTLLRSWLRETPTVAWVSLDEADQDASTFWGYVAASLDRAVPGAGAGTVALLAAGSEPTEEMLAGLVNELSVLPDEVTLVLDDYHLADGPGVQRGMSYLLAHLPSQMQLVISTRADPTLHLARVRARGELTEVRAADLRFTNDEAVAYLNDVTMLSLTPDDIAALGERTEGWVAALQLAALSLRGRDDTSGFIRSFAGDDRYVVDYLVEEVLDRQPGPVRTFLLETSILDRLTGSLCDAVSCTPGGGSGLAGKAMLEQLDRANLFLVPLDDQRRWYRYHHLFGDLLRSRLIDEHADVAELHRRASRWHDEHADPVSAVRHALAAGDLERVADLVETAVPELLRTRQEATLGRWMGDLPAEVVQRRPVLAMGFVGALMASNKFNDVERRLRHIEQALTTEGDAPPMVVVDQAELVRLPGEIELYRAALALVSGDPTSTLSHARRSVNSAPGGDELTRASAAALVGLAAWTTGDLEAAHDGYTAAADGLRRLGHLSDVLGCTVALADVATIQGSLGRAEQSFRRALALVADEDPRMRGIGDMHIGLAQIALERNDLTAAREHLRRCDELGEAAGLPQNPYRWRMTMAVLREVEGDLDTALDLLTEAERAYVADFQPNVRPIAAVRARLLAAHGNVPAALAWARQHGLSAEDELSYLREYEHLTLARVLLVQHSADGSLEALHHAAALLPRLLTATEEGRRDGTLIEVLALSGLASRAAGQHADALDAVERALTLAEPEGFVRVFAGLGQPMAVLLAALQQRQPGWTYLRQALDATALPLRDRAARPGPAADGSTEDHLVEPLTGRERDVMRLLASDLDGPSIARELVLSLNTVRTHTKNIYTKLGVTSRRAAVNRAHQLNLLGHTGPH